MEPRVAVLSIWAEDVPLTAHFYRDVLGLTMLPHHDGDRPHFSLGGAFLVILQGQPLPARNSKPERFPIFALEVDDLELRMEKLRAHQVALPWGIEGDPGSRWIMFSDPAGNLIELVEFPAPG